MCFRPPEVSEIAKKCPECGQFNPKKAVVCKKCGADISEA